MRLAYFVFAYVMFGTAIGGLSHGHHLQKCPMDVSVVPTLSDLTSVALFWPSAVFTVISAPTGLDYAPCKNQHAKSISVQVLGVNPMPFPAEIVEADELNFPDYDFAVFNMHVNNAGKRALAIVRRMMRHPSEIIMMDALERDYENGVMAIFKREPDEATRAFCVLVFAFANGLDLR